MADDTRLKSLLLIAQEKELCVCELTEALQETQPKVSRHLAQLRKCQLLTDRRQGQWVYYRINPTLEDWAKLVIENTLVSNQAFLSENIKNLENMGDRPERTKNCCA